MILYLCYQRQYRLTILHALLNEKGFLFKDTRKSLSILLTFTFLASLFLLSSFDGHTLANVRHEIQKLVFSADGRHKYGYMSLKETLERSERLYKDNIRQRGKLIEKYGPGIEQVAS